MGSGFGSSRWALRPHKSRAQRSACDEPFGRELKVERLSRVGLRVQRFSSNCSVDVLVLRARPMRIGRFNYIAET